MSGVDTIQRTQVPSVEDKLKESIYQNDWLLYTTSDEDSDSEIRALDIQNEDVVLSVTGSGCRSLALLIKEPSKLISIDANPYQNFLLELKMAAIKHFEREDCLAFFGITESENRREMFQQVKEDLSEQAQTFWLRHIEKIEKGFIYLGKHEMFYKKYMGSFLFRFRRKQFKELLACETIEQQRDYFDKNWNNFLWKRAVKLLSQRVFFEKFLGDPSYFNQVKKDFSIGDYLLSRFEHTFKHHLVQENHFLTFLFCGHYINDKGLPVYLLKENYDIIKRNLHRVEIVTDRIDPYLASLPERAIDKYSLSDISGWIPLEEFRFILEDVKRTMSENGRLCYRNFLAKRTLSEVGIAGLQQDNAMMAELDATDRAFAFSFEVAQKEETNESVLRS
ncbi:DUF3419 family protein [Shouchella lehensis]|uniref:S-adenosylmethionine:diacylglycerol 3-amino-3-carboxypropyl transferase n=1 Tax=Shouchella lehensis G1 TaxID=1246626 RepID=A0A060LT34_9BACI|nr:DUF3419 family protein [Shouchella lehensis]AIC93130.1 hypothetical protein BleG1_0522 [Shouchella lehensis G1]